MARLHPPEMKALMRCWMAAPEPTAPPGTQDFFQQSKAYCEGQGGRFGTRPGGGEDRVCYRTPSDANTSCSVGTDCEGLCLARSRTCAPVVPLFGCNDVITDSGLPATVCID